jgi:hypothetical protein
MTSNQGEHLSGLVAAANVIADVLITRGGEWHPNATAANFVIKEIHIAGSNGEITLKGDAVHTSFVVVPKAFYSFGPLTPLLILTYK